MRVRRRFLIHPAHSVGINACRLFAHHVLVVLEGQDGQFRVLVVRCRDQHCLTHTAFNQRAALIKHLHAVRQVRFGPGLPAFLAVGNGCQLNLRRFNIQDKAAVRAAHIAQANDAQLDFSHAYPSPIRYS